MYTGAPECAGWRRSARRPGDPAGAGAGVHPPPPGPPGGGAGLRRPVPQFRHAEAGVPAAHVPDQPQLRFCVLIGMAVGPPGLTGQGCHASIPASPPKGDVRPALVVRSDGPADAVFLRVLHQGLPICRALGDTLAQEGFGLLSHSWYLTTPTITNEALSFLLFLSLSNLSNLYCGPTIFCIRAWSPLLRICRIYGRIRPGPLDLNTSQGGAR